MYKTEIGQHNANRPIQSNGIFQIAYSHKFTVLIAGDDIHSSNLLTAPALGPGWHHQPGVPVPDFRDRLFLPAPRAVTFRPFRAGYVYVP
jgi:hypothetical protein